MQYLVALSEERSFSKAAEACYVTQSTLSAGIAAMETILGHSLVDRSKRGVHFSALGAQILPEIKSALKQAESIIDISLSMNVPMTGPMRLGIIPTIAPYLLPQSLQDIQKEFPNLDLQIHEDLSDQLIEKLHSNVIDVALMAFPFKSKGITEHHLFSEEFVLATPKSLFDKTGPVQLSTLEPHDILLLNEGHCLRDHALEACRLDSTASRKTYSATSLATLIQMVEQGLGATLLPEMAINHSNLSKNTNVVRFKSPTPKRIIGLAWVSGNRRSEDFKTLGKLLTSIHKP